jgi:hypothetical protein
MPPPCPRGICQPQDAVICDDFGLTFVLFQPNSAQIIVGGPNNFFSMLTVFLGLPLVSDLTDMSCPLQTSLPCLTMLDIKAHWRVLLASPIPSTQKRDRERETERKRETERERERERERWHRERGGRHRPRAA